MKRNKNNPNRNILFEIGDLVLVKKDFNEHQDHKRKKLDSFYEAKQYEIVELKGNNTLILKNGNEIKTVLKNQVKKLN